MMKKEKTERSKREETKEMGNDHKAKKERKKGDIDKQRITEKTKSLNKEKTTKCGSFTVILVSFEM
jgi:hypothetical protein